jgi:hypothetical protein
MKIINEAWEKRVSETSAHIKINQWLGSINDLNSFYDLCIRDNNFENKTVIDYGIGGGYLGLYLFQNKGIKKYIGYDVAKRSIIATEKNLKEFENKELIYIEDVPDFKKADYFISIAVIQHFPTKDYLDEFLDKLNKSGCKNIILQVRDGKTEFRKDVYKTTDSIAWACHTNEDYINERLTNYTLTYNSGVVNKAKSKILQYKIKGKKNV